MIQKTIFVPDFVADEFEEPLRHINVANDSVTRSIERVYKLINSALQGLHHPDWEVGQRRYHSKNAIEPYCFNVIEGKFYIWIEVREEKSPIAIFKSRYLAADYFVWIVSKGERKIDWNLFVEEEP